jgi:hypothetical protein
LPVLTEVDGSMNPLEELDDTTRTRKFGVKPVCYENVRLQLHTSRVHIYTLSWHDSWWTTSTIFDT